MTVRSAMRLLPAAVVILSFLSAGHTAPLCDCCDRLTQTIPIEISQLLGTWILVGETINIPGIKSLTKRYVESAQINISAVPDSNFFKTFQSQKTFGSCMSFTITSQVTNNSIHWTIPYEAHEVLLTTDCPDCLVIRGNFTFGSNYYQSLQLLSRRRVLTTAELDQFKTQAECLGLLPPVFMDPEKELCSIEQGTESRDITSLLHSDMATQALGVLETVINSEQGLTGFFNSINEHFQTPKQD